MRRTRWAFLLVPLLVLAACAENDESGTGTEVDEPATADDGATDTAEDDTAETGDDATEGDGGEGDTFAIVLPSSITDQAFSQSGYEGAQAGTEAVGAELLFQENVQVPDAEEAFRNLAAQGPTAVIGLGGQFADAGAAVAAEFPDIHFVVVNGSSTGENLSSFSLAEGESAYLAGIVVATLAEPESLGHVAGIEIPPLVAASFGFEQGALSVDPDIEFTRTFTGDMDDVALAKEAALSQFAAGVDVVYTSMNGAITGLEQAATEAGGLLWNNIFDKCDLVEGAYYGFTASRTDAAVASIVEGIADGSLEPGFEGTNLEDDAAVQVGTCDAEITPELQAVLDDTRAQLVSGELTVEVG